MEWPINLHVVQPLLLFISGPESCWWSAKSIMNLAFQFSASEVAWRMALRLCIRNCNISMNWYVALSVQGHDVTSACRGLDFQQAASLPWLCVNVISKCYFESVLLWSFEDNCTLGKTKSEPAVSNGHSTTNLMLAVTSLLQCFS